LVKYEGSDNKLTLDCINNLIFDLDGTLIDSSEGVIKATNYALARIDERPRRPEEIKPYIGYPLEDMFKSFSNKSYEEFHTHFQHKAKIVVVESAIPIEGADYMLSQLRKRGYRMGVGTTKIRIHIEKILTKLGWRDFFEAYAGADDVDNVKPDPEVFNKVLNMMGARRDNTLIVGDTANDVIAAKKASLPVIAVRSQFGMDGELEKSSPDKIIERIDDILKLLPRAYNS